MNGVRVIVGNGVGGKVGDATKVGVALGGGVGGKRASGVSLDSQIEWLVISEFTHCRPPYIRNATTRMTGHSPRATYVWF